MKRLFVTLALAWLALLAACDSGQATPEIIDVDPSALQLLIAGDDFYVGTPRVPLIIYDGVDPATTVQSVGVILFDLAQDPPVAIWQGPAREYVSDTVRYWTAYPEIPRAGRWGLQLNALRADGAGEQYQRSIEATDLPRSPAIGTQPPASQNRTLATNDISELTSGRDPDPALYQMTVAEALADGRPTVVTFATPAFCQTRICAPVVDTVAAVQEQIGSAANFIHLEIYKDFQTLETADEVGEWGLTSEPWTFILDGDGNVVNRLAGPVSETEILEQLEPLLNG